jgi:hypothetical protein
MGWLSKLLNKVANDPPPDLIFVTSLRRIGETPSDVVFEPDGCYVELYVEALRLARARRFASTFHGVVYSFVSLSREGDASAQFAAVSKPEKLATLDEHAIDRVITVSKQMLAPTPWRGGNLDLQLGLFAVKASNLLTPVLDYVTRVSTTAGISFAGAVKPFLPLITEGMDLITNQSRDTVIEVGVDTSLTLTKPGVFAVIAARKGSIDETNLSVDLDGRLLLGDIPLDRAYCVFSIRRTDRKPDYGEIPELRVNFAKLLSAIRSNRRKDADEALSAFRLAAIASSDLISSDARTLIEKATRKVKDAFPGGGVAARSDSGRALESLSDLDLYN